MSFFSKILPAVAFAVVLFPLTAQALNNPPQYYLTALHHDPVMVGSATIDHPTTIFSGQTAQKFPASVGG